MNLRVRAAWLALLLLATPAAPALHAAFEEGHSLHDCCTHENAPAHIDACAEEHHEACDVCDAARPPMAAGPDMAPVQVDLAGDLARAAPAVPFADPYHVDTPGSRGPPV